MFALIDLNFVPLFVLFEFQLVQSRNDAFNLNQKLKLFCQNHVQRNLLRILTSSTLPSTSTNYHTSACNSQGANSVAISTPAVTLKFPTILNILSGLTLHVVQPM